MHAPRLALLAFSLSVASCGGERSLLDRHAAWPGSWTTGSLAVANVPFCSATLVAPDVVVTSARCARLAVGGATRFVWSHGVKQFETPVRDGYVVERDGTLAEATFWHPAVTPEARAVMRSIARHCHVSDLFSLTRTPRVRNCLDELKPSLLRAAGGLGLANWQDVGWLGLKDAVPTEPAVVLAASDAPILHEGPELRRIGIRRVRGPRPWPWQRYEHEYQVYAADAHELHVGPWSGRAHEDVGSALWVPTFASGAWAWRLAGVGSRPFVAHSDTSAGVIFTRLDAHLPAMAQAVARLSRPAAP